MENRNEIILELLNLNKNFGGLTVTKDLNLTVRTGQIFGIIGPNGAGKSTLFNEISGYIRPDSGAVKFCGTNITGLPPNKVCKLGIGRTFQIVKPFPNKDVLYNVVVGAFARTNKLDEAKETANNVVKMVGLEKRKNILAKNLTIVDRKRLEFAKALSTKPKLLLLDEILAGLTPSEIEEAIDLIREIKRSGITIIMIEHVMQAVMAVCEQVLVINYGEKIAEGTPECITKNQDVISCYLGGGHAAKN
jgi:branched-chain amino acid transport system ATP-binding protein